jgi:hypothetical protein
MTISKYKCGFNLTAIYHFWSQSCRPTVQQHSRSRKRLCFRYTICIKNSARVSDIFSISYADQQMPVDGTTECQDITRQWCQSPPMTYMAHLNAKYQLTRYVMQSISKYMHKCMLDSKSFIFNISPPHSILFEK